MARVVVAGAGAIGASIAYHLALAVRDDVVLADVAARSRAARPAKAMGGVRQQFTTAAEVRLAQASDRASSRSSGRRSSSRSATSSSRRPTRGSPRSRSGASCRRALGVPVERVDPARVGGLRADDVLGASSAGGRRAPTRRRSRVSSCARAVELGVEVRERTDALALDGDDARGRLRRRAPPRSRRPAGVELPGAAARAASSLDVGAARRPPGRPADDDRGGDGVPLPPRRRRRAACSR